MLTANQFNISPRTLTQGLTKILLFCTEKEITNKHQFNILTYGTYNKVIVVKQFLENILYPDKKISN